MTKADTKRIETLKARARDAAAAAARNGNNQAARHCAERARDALAAALAEVCAKAVRS